LDIHLGRRIYGDENGGAEVMDFSSVKKIVIPEGEVKKITDSSGAVLWEGNITFYVKTALTTFKLSVPSGSTWRDAAEIYTDDPEIIVQDDMIWGGTVEIQYYYSGARLATINNVMADDFIEADKTYTAQ
jgi:hypothetical protein